MEKLKSIVNVLKEKTKQVATICGRFCVDAYDKCVPFFKNLFSYKKQLIMAGAAVVLVATAAFGFYFFKDTLISWIKKESPTFSAIRKAELVATGKVGSKVLMGDLEISLLDVVEGSYHPLEVDEEFKRVPPRGYFGARITIFNTGYNEKEFLLIVLTDDLGNQYERDKDIDFYVDGIKDFGPAREIYPRTIRGGDIGNEKYYLLFSEIHSDAKKLQLVVMSETQNKKAVFDIDR